MALHYSIIISKGSHCHCVTSTLHPWPRLFYEEPGATKLHLTWWTYLIASLNLRLGEAKWHCCSFHFVDVCVNGTDDLEVQLTQTCSWWKSFRCPLPVAQMCLPWLRVRLRGLAHSGDETCAHKRLTIKTDVKTEVVYKESSDLLPLVLPAYRLFELRNGAPFYTLRGVLCHMLGTHPLHSSL